jgi:hypothetical protein
VKDVLKYQPHILYDDLVIAQVKMNTVLTRGEKADSIDDFETYAEKHV